MILCAYSGYFDEEFGHPPTSNTLLIQTHDFGKVNEFEIPTFLDLIYRHASSEPIELSAEAEDAVSNARLFLLGMEYAVEVIIEISLSTVVRFLDDLMAAPLPGSLQLYRFLYLAELIFNRLYTDRDYEEQESYLMDKIVECFLRLLEAGSMDGLPREETDIKMDLYQMQRFTQAVQRKLDELWG